MRDALHGFLEGDDAAANQVSNDQDQGDQAAPRQTNGRIGIGKGGDKVSTVELDGVTEIHPYAFINCTSIVSFKASDKLSTIGTDAFRNCSSLVKVELGSGVGQIGKQAFMNCKALKSVTCKAQTPPTLGNNDVFSYNHEARKFYVPATAVEAYKSDGMWSKYGSSIEEIDN